jgi:hypothetical protein
MLPHSSEAMSISSKSKRKIADNDSEIFAGDDGTSDEDLESETEVVSDSESASEENVDIQTMYAVYDDGLESD